MLKCCQTVSYVCLLAFHISIFRYYKWGIWQTGVKKGWREVFFLSLHFFPLLLFEPGRVTSQSRWSGCYLRNKSEADGKPRQTLKKPFVSLTSSSLWQLHNSSGEGWRSLAACTFHLFPPLLNLPLILPLHHLYSIICWCCYCNNR